MRIKKGKRLNVITNAILVNPRPIAYHKVV